MNAEPPRQTVFVEVFDLTHDEWTRTIPELIAWFEEELSAVPEEFRDHVKIIAKRHDVCDYDDKIVITASYGRLENDKEFQQRIARDKFWAEDSEKRDRLEYERLKAKFGP